MTLHATSSSPGLGSFRDCGEVGELDNEDLHLGLLANVGESRAHPLTRPPAAPSYFEQPPQPTQQQPAPSPHMDTPTPSPPKTMRVGGHLFRCPFFDAREPDFI